MAVGGDQRWPRGAEVVWRSLLPDGRTAAYLMQAVMVLDGDVVIALHQPPGTVCRRRTGRRGGPRGRSMLPGGWDGGYEDRPWTGNTVRVHVIEAGYSVIRSWQPAAGTFTGDWYVNLELPWRRTATGFDSADLTLDLVVSEDLTGWRWKDEDELAWKHREGMVDDDLVAYAYAQGGRALSDLRDRAIPFRPDRWRDWAPPGRARLPDEVIATGEAAVAGGADVRR